MPSDGELLAPWIRTLPLADQVFITGATLILADIAARHPARFDIDERRLREDPAPEGVRRYATEIAERYQDAGDEEGKRVVALCHGVAAKTADHFPAG